MNDKHNKHWHFEKTKFIEMWDEWYRGKVDPRRENDLDNYRTRGRVWLLNIRQLTIGLLIFTTSLVVNVIALLKMTQTI